MADIAAERIVDDVATLKALADPIRLTLLELTMREPERTWTARELATEVAVLPTNIYYHLNMLERHGLLQVRDTRVVNGIIEKHYGASQLSLVFHRRSSDTQEGLRQVVAAMLMQARDDIDAGLAAGTMSGNREAPDAQRMMVSRAMVHIPDDEIAQFRLELLKLVQKYERPDAQGPLFTVIVAMHPS